MFFKEKVDELFKKILENKIEEAKLDSVGKVEQLDEGAVAVSTVKNEIRKNGGTQIKDDGRFITFIYMGREHKIPVDRGFVRSDVYMKLKDMM